MARGKAQSQALESAPGIELWPPPEAPVPPEARQGYRRRLSPAANSDHPAPAPQVMVRE
ncbi:hypothetical protein [Nodosilinea sp. P-1105]|uniref:hypothetical protein n=1 Tax=Nodosilinea sp. P-1105 TaxID=2546229 RepID=UPI00146BCE5F|nr:hypothetical protein [Nodosilinea sp. P-1105]